LPRLSIPNARRLESALTRHDAVLDCRVFARVDDSGRERSVAYVVPTGPWSPDALTSHLRARVPDLPPPDHYLGVSVLPVTEAGVIDDASLARLPVSDEELVERWRAKVDGLGPGRAAVLIDEHRPHFRPWHLSDLLPSPPKARSAAGAGPSRERDASAAPVTESGPLAVCEAPALPIGPDEPRTLTSVLRRAIARATCPDLVFVTGEGSEERVALRTLVEQAECVLGGLRRLGLRPGDPVLLQLADHRSFLTAFWGCILGGFPPTPMAVPASYATPAALDGLRDTWDLLARPTIVADDALAREIRAAAERSPAGAIPVTPLSEIGGERDGDWHSAEPDDVALMMLTSGSTGRPKAVMLRHANLVDRARGSRERNGFSHRDVSLNWMPLDHVAGLIYFHLRDVDLGCLQIHVPTGYVLEAPLRWLELLERFAVTVTFAPNFAYGLVGDLEPELARRRFDLASVRLVLNGAEAIVARTARRFLRLLAAHGLRSDAMRPAWGMSETSSGVTYAEGFSLASTSDDDPFVSVGRPIPGVSLRVVDERDAPLREGQIGALQVRGTTVMAGYRNDDAANREAFTPDGWFRTGDLGFIQDGQLTITGREKDVVIINSVNYYSHAIESVVEELAGIETSFTAACAIRRPGEDTDQLAIFFAPTSRDPTRLRDLLRQIGANVRERIGVGVDHFVPVRSTADVPKTSLGKIQRSRLGQDLVDGRFDDVLREVDVLLGNANTLPDWFFRRVWQRRDGSTDATAGGDARGLLLLGGSNALSRAILDRAESSGSPCIRVSAGETFERRADGSYHIDPGRADHYELLLKSVAADGRSIDRVVHLWSHGAPDERAPRTQTQTPTRHAMGFLHLVRALRGCVGADRSVQVMVVSSRSQALAADEPLELDRVPVRGLIKSIVQEAPELDCRHVDVPESEPDGTAACILRESRVLQTEREVAYRDGRRHVVRLGRAALHTGGGVASPIPQGARLVISGGLGGIGTELALHLIREYDAKLLLLGRSSLDPAGEADGRADAFARLRAVGADVRYEAVDVTDADRVEEAVARAEDEWGRPVDGAIHLAGAYHERPVLEETGEGLEALLSGKLLGALSLRRVLERRGGGLFVSFSSVAGFFGGASVGAYAAASACLDALADAPSRTAAVRQLGFAWTNWENTGQSRETSLQELARARGYLQIAPERAMKAFEVGLRNAGGTLLVGLDRANRNVRRMEVAPPCGLTEICVCHTGAPGTFAVPDVRDRFGTRSECRSVPVAAIPETPDGEIDFEALRRLLGRRKSGGEPRTPTEKALAGIWKRLLNRHAIDRHDSFFELGGDSLLAARLLNQIRDAFESAPSLRAVFEAEHLADLARATDAARAHASAAETAPRSRGEDAEGLLARVDEMSIEEVEALLQELDDEESTGR
jgi:acyl-CoA synthetase (AMP-forming)/AMP-acid ligase II/NAD(P)-dependent dehydrogenase (short-subunit alcohol dehydrogenase family)